MLLKKALSVKHATSARSTSSYSSGGISSSIAINSCSSIPDHFQLPRSMPSLRRKKSSMSARASAGAERYSASAVSTKFRSSSLVVSKLVCGLSSQPTGTRIRRSTCRATFAPIFLRPHLRCEQYRCEKSNRSAKSLSIPLFGRCACCSLKRRNNAKKFSCLMRDVVSIFLSSPVRTATNRILFALYNCYLFNITPKTMNAKQYRDKYGRLACLALCDKVGTTYEYFKHFCNSRKRPSVGLARKMVKHSGGDLTLDDLLIPDEKIRLVPSQLAKKNAKV